MEPTTPLTANDAAVVSAILEAPTPMIVVEVPSGLVVGANAGAAALVGLARNELVGRPVASVLEPGSAATTATSFGLLADKVVDSYRATRLLRHADGHVVAVEVWTRRISDHHAVAVLVDETSTSSALAQAEPDANHPLAVGVADDSWHVQHITAEIQGILGWPPGRVHGTALLTAMHPDDLPDLLAAVDRTGTAMDAAAVPVRVLDEDGVWRSMQCVFAPLTTQDGGSRIGFALCEFTDWGDGGPPGRTGAKRFFVNLAADVRTLEVLDRLRGLPDLGRFPELSDLTTRQWEVLARLLAGDRVPTIAKELYVSQSTVRNHLSAIFRVVGVRSQAELLARLR